MVSMWNCDTTNCPSRDLSRIKHQAIRFHMALCERLRVEFFQKIRKAFFWSPHYANQSMNAQKKQFDSLAQHMDEMRKARHDLRQHLAVVQSYIEKDDKEGLHNYIAMYKNELPPYP